MPKDVTREIAPERRPERLLRPLARAPFVTAAITAGLILVLTVFIVTVMRADRLEKIEAESLARAEFVAARLEAYVETRLSLAALLRDKWRSGRIRNRADFARETAPKLRQFTALQAINWVDPRGVIRWIAPEEGNEGARNLDINSVPGPAVALALARQSGRLALTGPIDLAQGGDGFVAYLPIDGAEGAQGFINIVFRTDRLFDRILENRLTRDYALSVTDEGRTLYESGPIKPTASGHAATELAIRNRVWTVAAAPTPATQQGEDKPLDGLVLGFGILAAGLVAGMVYFALAAHRRLRDERRRLADYAAVSSDWFWEMDADLRFTYFSNRFEAVTGLTRASLIGRTRGDLSAPSTDPATLEDHLAQMRAHQPFRDFVYRYARADGEILYISTSGTPVFDETGAFAGYRGIGRDITDQKRGEEALNAALRDAEQASQAKSDFLATMSHEFRTPLNAIIGFSDILESEMFGPLGSARYRAYATDIQNSGQHMLALVNDVLDLARLEAGKRPLDVEPIALDTFLPDCLRPFLDLAERRGVRLTLHAADAFPPLHADRRALTQVIYNLLSNAIKFTPAGGTVTLAAQADDETKTLELSVRDTGTGISEDLLARIVEPFVQDRIHPHITQEGSGLGLAIVHALTEAHGGELDIDSTLGAGTTVRVTLPLSGPPDEMQEREALERDQGLDS